MSKNQKITISIIAFIIIIILSIFSKLAFSNINSPFLKEKISTYVLSVTDKKIEIDEVRLRFINDLGLALEIPNAVINYKGEVLIKNTIVDIDLFSILFKGLINSNIKISSELALYKEQLFDLEVISNGNNFIIKKLNNNNFSLNEDIHLKKDNPYIFDVNFFFKKEFIDKNFSSYLEKINNDYDFKMSNFFFNENSSYQSKLKIDLNEKEIKIEKLGNKHNINIKSKISYFENDIKINIKSAIQSVNFIKILNQISLKKDTNNKKILKFLSDSLYKEQNIETNLKINKNFEPKNINITASGLIDLDYQFDKNEDPSFLKGKAPYKITLLKENFFDEMYNISSIIDLTDAELYIRQINFQKNIKKNLNVKLDSYFNLKKNIKLNISSSSEDLISINGNIELIEKNVLNFNNIYFFNTDNVDIALNGSLKNKKLIAKLSGNYIDLSKNIIKINDKLRDYYFKSEQYEITSKVAHLNGDIFVDDISINIDKKKNMIKVQSSGYSKGTFFDYIREKNTKSDVSIINSENIINTVGPKHSSRELIKYGEATVSSYREIGSLDSNIEIDLRNFILINTPATLKLLSMPSFSGLNSVLNNESGIEFAYGKLTYKVNDISYSDINAFAVNDGIGLIINGNIDRKNKDLNLEGQISPLHLVSGMIQKIPFFGKILIGNDGEGIVAVEYSMSGDLDNPDVSSNPLTIFKPRLFQRTIDFFFKNRN